MGEELNDHILFSLISSIGLLKALGVLLHNLRGSLTDLADEPSQLLNFAHFLRNYSTHYLLLLLEQASLLLVVRVQLLVLSLYQL